MSIATAMCKVQQGHARLLVFVGASLSATPAFCLRWRLEAVVEEALRMCGKGISDRHMNGHPYGPVNTLAIAHHGTHAREAASFYVTQAVLAAEVLQAAALLHALLSCVHATLENFTFSSLSLRRSLSPVSWSIRMTWMVRQSEPPLRRGIYVRGMRCPPQLYPGAFTGMP